MYCTYYRSIYRSLFSILILVILINRADVQKTNDKESAGNPLILTTFIENKKVVDARKVAKVPSRYFHNLESYAGFLTVDKRFDSNLFFWFFPAQANYETSPLLLWLQGGPGASSLFSIFNGNGPFIFDSSSNMVLNEYSWIKNHSVLYIDNPVHTGFSFTNGGFARNQTKVGQDLYEALKQFFIIFHELQKNEFYVAGESYAGKYVPAISYKILKENSRTDLKINLKGMAIGNGMCDPINQLGYSEYLYQIGLIDSAGKQQFSELEKEAISYIKAKEFRKAFKVFDGLLNGDLNEGATLFKNLTGFKWYFNYLTPGHSFNFKAMFNFLQQDTIRKAIHVGNLNFTVGNEVEEYLLEDVMVSVAPWIEELLSQIKVLFYNGQLDIIMPYPLMVNFLQHLNFDSADAYKVAERHIWYDDEEIAGYVKQAGNLTEVLIRNAGHNVPAEQPKWALDLITTFIRNQKLYK